MVSLEIYDVADMIRNSYNKHVRPISHEVKVTRQRNLVS